MFRAIFSLIIRSI